MADRDREAKQVHSHAQCAFTESKMRRKRVFIGKINQRRFNEPFALELCPFDAFYGLVIIPFKGYTV